MTNWTSARGIVPWSGNRMTGEMPAEWRAAVNAARGAAQRVLAQARRSFADWLLIGQGIDTLQRTAMERAAKSRRGKRYSDALHELMTRHMPEYSQLKQGDRSLALWMHIERAAVIRWHNTLPEGKRAEINSPTAVRRAFMAAHRPPTRKQGNTRADLMRLQAEYEKLARRLQAAERDRDWAKAEAESLSKQNAALREQLRHELARPNHWAQQGLRH